MVIHDNAVAGAIVNAQHVVCFDIQFVEVASHLLLAGEDNRDHREIALANSYAAHFEIGNKRAMELFENVSPGSGRIFGMDDDEVIRGRYLEIWTKLPEQLLSHLHDLERLKGSITRLQVSRGFARVEVMKPSIVTKNDASIDGANQLDTIDIATVDLAANQTVFRFLSWYTCCRNEDHYR